MSTTNQYYITSIDYNVLGNELDVILCEYDGKIEFRQPHFQRAWTVCEFKDQFEALKAIEKLYPLATLRLFEDTGKVLTQPNSSPECWLTSIVIKKYRGDLC